MIVVELASPGELPALVRLLGILFAQEAEFRPDPSRQEAGLRIILDAPSLGEVLVARDGDGVVVGMAVVLFVPSTALGKRAALLEDVVVDSAHRGLGIGTALVQAAVQRAGDAGCGRVTLLTDEDNGAAQRFYGRHGFVRSSMIPMRRSLE